MGGVAWRGSLVPEEPVLERGNSQGDPCGDEGPDGLEACNGLGVPLDLLLEGEQAVDLEERLVAQRTGQVPFPGR